MLHIETITVTPFAQNARILSVAGHEDAVVVDPGGDVPLIEDALRRRKLRCSEIWLTHSHIDHCAGVAALMRSYPATLFGHPDEAAFRTAVIQVCRMYGLPEEGMENCPEPTRMLRGGETLTLHGISFEVLFTPGHSPGHLCFYCAAENLLIGGDLLFQGSVGRTDLPGGNGATLLQSIRSKVLVLPPATKVLAGHGPDTTVGAEARSNPFILGT
jgi:glyoxylase-like metal-dependent hydrolase (beta-lactamase superfamily II)